MPRSRRKDSERPLLATFLSISFVLGALLGAVIATTWVQGLPALQLSPGEAYTRSITIVGIDKTTGQGRLATLVVELRAGTGRLMIAVPPYENEDTQKAALGARTAAERETGWSLGQVDIIISVENLAAETIIAGPSASAAAAVLIVATVNTSKNRTPNQVRQDVVVSASINKVGKLEPVGQITEKYQTVRKAGIYSLFVVAQDQRGYLPNYPGVSVERARNLSELISKVLW
ncbi:MAG: hypothetical protein QMD95_04395 [Candidatus Hodarchaeaceae archaeon]|nr:hypothetical protein [Candidatus Hodarchaeaceae archaeon]